MCKAGIPRAYRRNEKKTKKKLRADRRTEISRRQERKGKADDPVDKETATMYNEADLEEFSFAAFRELQREIEGARGKPTRPGDPDRTARKPVSMVRIKSVENLNHHVVRILKSEEATRTRRKSKEIVRRQYEGARPEPQRKAARRHALGEKDNKDPTPRGHRRITLPDGKEICIPVGARKYTLWTESTRRRLRFNSEGELINMGQEIKRNACGPHATEAGKECDDKTTVSTRKRKVVNGPKKKGELRS
jgi:hypothetical protein